MADPPGRVIFDVPAGPIRVEEEPTIVLRGMQPRSRVTIEATTEDGARVVWASSAQFDADDHGVVDLARQAPVDGTYTGVDPAGLLWSMTPREGGRPMFTRRRPRPLELELTASQQGANVASLHVSWSFLGSETVVTPLDGPDAVGTLFTPAEQGRWPGIIVLGGSDGGELAAAAAVLSAHGFSVMSLAYFGVEDRPAQLLDIDLEGVESAVSWMADHPNVAGDTVSLIGLSRGAELALELASHHPRVTAVVAGSPSAVRHAGLPGNSADYTRPAWLRGGEPLPYVKGRNDVRGFASIASVLLLKRPLRLVTTFRRNLDRDAEQAERARIEVENIRAPVMLIAGAQDQLWPSMDALDDIRSRRAAAGVDDRDAYLEYADAGHFLCFPYSLPNLPPTTSIRQSPRMTMDFGGDVTANHAAAEDSWPRILEFLRAAGQTQSADDGG